VKFSLSNETDRELSKQGVLSENQAYQYLQDKGIYFIPKYKGMYTWPGGFALILSDEGQAIADSGSEFKELAWWKR
jgi:hypothetical protein